MDKQQLFNKLLQAASVAEEVKDTQWKMLRAAGQKALLGQELPGRESENYRYTPIEKRLIPALSITYAHPSTDNVPLQGLYLPGYHVIVSPKGVSVPSDLPKGITITCITSKDLLPRCMHSMGNYAHLSADAFVALNTYGFDKILYVHVQPGIQIANTVYFHHLNSVAAQITYPRTFCFFGARSRVTVVDIVYTTQTTPHFINHVTERFLEPHAAVTNVLWQLGATRSLYQFRYDYTILAAHAQCSNYTVTCGGGVVRNQHVTRLTGNHSHVASYGCYLAQEHSYIESQVHTLHESPSTRSNTLYKGVACQQSTCVFHGNVHVQQQAQQTEASQYHHWWLFDQATIYGRPDLDIHADDVVCKHGATLGKGIEEMLFYVRTRGLTVAQATQLMLQGFLRDAMTSYPHEDHLALISKTIQEWLATAPPVFAITS